MKTSRVDHTAYHVLNALVALTAYMVYKKWPVRIDDTPCSVYHNCYWNINYEKYKVIRYVRRIMAGKETKPAINENEMGLTFTYNVD